MGRHALPVGLVLVALAAAVAGGWYYFRQAVDDACGACRRPVHRHSKTVGLAEGQRQVFCCPSCALSEVRQTGREVKLIELTDFESGDAVIPDKAYIVHGSHINPCRDHSPHVGAHSQPLAQHFDRCAPSALAFSTRAAADAFCARHGGRVISFADLAQSARIPAPDSGRN
jgi:hypothetical protein